MVYADLALVGGGRPTVAGASWADPAVAHEAALGEAVERYCGHRVASGSTMDTWHGLRERGLPAVDPAALALYRPGQPTPFAGLTRDDKIAWTVGTTPDGATTWLPATLCSLSPIDQDRPAHLPISAGIAAGPTLEWARAAALAEVVERHGLATAWHGGYALPVLHRRVPGWAGELRAVPNRFGAPVVIAVARRDGLLGIGCALGTDLGAGAAKAAAEATQSLRTVQVVAAGVPAWERPDGPLAAHRTDRRYLDSYAPGWADVTDIICHAQLLADPRIVRTVSARLAGGTAPPVGHTWSDVGLELDTALATQGFVPLTVELTTPDVATAGYAVARVVVPGLRSTAPAAFPFLGDGADPLPAHPCLIPLPHV
ncbi:MAG: YcaO-like family protein [Pseudonocardiales bacterium]